MTHIFPPRTNTALRDQQSTKASAAPPVKLTTLPPGVTFTQMVGNNFSSGAIGSDGNVYVWGSNTGLTLGSGAPKSATVLVPTAMATLPAGNTVTAIGISYYSMSALIHDPAVTANLTVELTPSIMAEVLSAVTATINRGRRCPCDGVSGSSPLFD